MHFLRANVPSPHVIPEHVRGDLEYIPIKMLDGANVALADQPNEYLLDEVIRVRLALHSPLEETPQWAAVAAGQLLQALGVLSQNWTPRVAQRDSPEALDVNPASLRHLRAPEQRLPGLLSFLFLPGTTFLEFSGGFVLGDRLTTIEVREMPAADAAAANGNASVRSWSQRRCQLLMSPD
jgi:hypothetical protein